MKFLGSFFVAYVLVMVAIFGAGPHWLQAACYAGALGSLYVGWRLCRR